MKASFPSLRLRRLRRTPAIRAMFQETSFSLDDLVFPVFVDEGIEEFEAVSSMPGVRRIPESKLAAEVERYANVGIKAVMLFGVSHAKDSVGSDTWRDDGLVSRMVRISKDAVPEMIVMSDTCFCEYTDHGHCGVLRGNTINNDETLINLQRQAVQAAHSGADFIAPSAAVDGQVAAIRSALDDAKFSDVSILSYSTKLASALYGPFREAGGSTLEGDRKSYQMNAMNRREALRESLIDEAEGADALMVKPAGMYLDLIRELRNSSQLPIAAYQVSGEYSMIKFAALAGAIDEYQIVRESIGAMKRAGADIILSYFALDLAIQGI
jgi:porphobilinogen synthase